ncbi:MAG: M13 family metallopeptidase N-terminal domain-containing protein, partial [Opitutus sp.]
MKPSPLLVAVLGLATVVSLAADEMPPVPRFSADYMDKSVDPRVDFAHYAWGNWAKANPIPADKARWGAFAEVDIYNQTALKGILETAAAKSHEPGSVEQKVGDFYASAVNTAAIEAAGLRPVATDLAQVAAIASPADLARTLADLHNRGVNGLFNIGVGADAKKSDTNALYARQGGLTLPSRDYYFAEQHAKVREAFLAHLGRMFVLAGDTPEAAAANAKTVFEVETSLATNAKSPVELRDRLANYSKMP